MKAIHCPICHCDLIVEFNGVTQQDNIDFAMNHLKLHQVGQIEDYFEELFAKEYLSLCVDEIKGKK